MQLGPQIWVVTSIDPNSSDPFTVEGLLAYKQAATADEAVAKVMRQVHLEYNRENPRLPLTWAEWEEAWSYAEWDAYTMPLILALP